MNIWIRNLCLLLALSGCTEAVTRSDNSRILMMGDSMFAWQKVSGRSVADTIEVQLGEPVTDRSVIGARFNYILPVTGALGLNISKQYLPGNWNWIILNGGGNDLWFGCGCISCVGTIDYLISEDARSGIVPDLVHRLRSSGARVVFVGYLHSPGVTSIVDSCKDEDIVYEERVAKLAANYDGIYYLPLSRLVPVGDRSYHAFDVIHPSLKGAETIGKLVADLIRKNDG